MVTPWIVAPTHYVFQSVWRIHASCEEVFAILNDVMLFPRWWPSVYLDARLVEPGAQDRRGRSVALRSKGWLPYSLKWTSSVTSTSRPTRIAIEATGDFVGTGVWELRPIGDETEVTFDWRIQVTSPLMKAGSFIVRPAFRANHRWAMARGQESLQLEVRRRAPAGETVPPPPRGTSALGVALLLLLPVVVPLWWWFW